MRDIRLAYRGKDLAGVRISARHAIFYCCDPKLNMHNTAHDPAPERGFSRSVVKTTRESPKEGEAAGVAWIVADETFDEPLAQTRNPRPIGQIVLLTDDESLEQYPEVKEDGRTRLLVTRTTVGIALQAWLVPAGAWYMITQLSYPRLGSEILADVSANPWIFLVVDGGGG